MSVLAVLVLGAFVLITAFIAGAVVLLGLEILAIQRISNSPIFDAFINEAINYYREKEGQRKYDASIGDGI